MPGKVELETSLSLDNLLGNLIELRSQLVKTSADAGDTSKKLKEGFDNSSSSIKNLKDQIGNVADLSVKAFKPDVVNKYAESFKTIGANIIQALSSASTAKLAPLQAQLQGVSGSFNQLRTVVSFLRDNITQLGLSGEDVKTLSNEFEKLDTVYKQVGEGSAGVVDKTNSLTRQLRAIKNELATIDDPTNPRFIELTKEAAELEEAIKRVNEQITLQASKTQLLDVGLEVIRGLTGGFAAVQGAQVLFGKENEDLQKTLLKVTAAMEVLHGLQEIGNVLNSKSAVNLFLLKALHLDQAAAITTEAAATEGLETAQAGQTATTEATTIALAEETVATEGAAVATEGLNAVMAANPALVLLAGIGALIAVLKLFGDSTKDNDEKQKKFNDTLKETNQILVELAEAGASTYKEAATSAEEALGLAQAQGKSEGEIFSLRQKSLQAKKQEAIYQLSYLGYTGATVEEMNKQVKVAEDLLSYRKEELHAVLSLLDSNGELSDSDKARAEKIKSEIGSLEGVTKKGRELVDSVKQTNAELEQSAAEREHQLYEESLKSATAAADARVILSKKGTQEELDNRIAAVRTGEREELAQVNLTKGERLKIQAQANKEIENLQRDFQNLQTENQIAANKAIVETTLAGSKERYDAEVNILKLTAQAAENIDGISAQKRKEIEDKLLHDLLQLEAQYNIERAKQRINPVVDDLNTQLALAKKNSEEELAIRQGLSKQLENLAKEEAQNDLSLTPNERSAKIKEIETKGYVERVNLLKDFIKTTTELRGNYIASVNTLDEAYQQAVVDSPVAKYKERVNAQKKLLEDELSDLQQQRTDKETEYKAGVIDYQEYATAINNIDAKIVADRAKLKAVTDKDKEFSFAKLFNFSEDDVKNFESAYSRIASAITGLTTAAIDASQSRLDAINAEISALDEQISKEQSAVDKEKELSDKGLANNLSAEQQKLSILQASKDEQVRQQQEMQAKLQDLQREQAAIQSASIAADSIETAVNLEKAAAKAIAASAGIPILGILLGLGAAASLIAGFVSIKNSINEATKHEKGDVAGGRLHVQGGNKYISMDGADPDVLEIEKGEYITNRRSTKKYLPLLDAINHDELSNWSVDDLLGLVRPSGLQMSMQKTQSSDTHLTQQTIVHNNKGDQKSIAVLEKIAKNTEKLVQLEREKETVEELPDKRIIRRGNFTRIIHKKP